MQIKLIKNCLRSTCIYDIYSYVKYKIYPIKLKKAGIINRKPTENAIQDKLLDGKKVIVSLTSFPQRMQYLQKGLYSLMNQEYKPNMIILWLSEDQFPNRNYDLPDEILELQMYGLTIRWLQGDLRSYKKLIPALKEFPEDIIVTADDDLYYPSDWLKKLVDAYLASPKCIHCHLITRLIINNSVINSVKKENWMKGTSSYYNKLLGGSGTLYPPHSLNQEVMNKTVFLDIAPTSDDIWFWAMAVINGTTIHWISNGIKELYYIEKTQENTPCLTKINDQEENLFKQHINAVAQKYGIIGLMNKENNRNNR